MEMIRNSIYCDDAVETMSHWPKDSVDLFIWSPPYDNVRGYKGFKLDLLGLGRECFRTLKDGGICAVVMQDGTKNFAKSLTTFRMTVDYVDVIGFRLFECVIYHRAGRPGKWWNQRFRVDHEYVMLFLKGDRPKYFNKEPLKVPAKYAGHIWSGTQRHTNGDLTPIKRTEQKPLRCPGTVWNIGPSTAEHNKLKLQHPATFPDKLAENLIICFSQEGELVVDPLCGSGTTLRMAKRNHRDWIGVDIALEYCEISRKGIENEREL